MKTNSVRLWFQLLFGFLFMALAASAQAVDTSAQSLSHAYPQTGALAGSEAMKMIRQHKNLTVVDVRTREEFEKGHIPGAISIPIQFLPQKMNVVPSGPVLLVCRTGRRAETAYHLIHDARPTQPLWYLQGRPVYAADGSYSFE